MIRLNKINKFFNKNKVNQNHVSKDINIEFKDNGLVVLLGNSGSGKTTLLNIISGMDKYDSGSLEFADETFTKYSSKKWDNIRKNKIGYIYQNYHLLKELTVYENIELVLKMYGVKDDEVIRERIEYLLESVGLSGYDDRLSKQLSGGQQQRVAFARALSTNPEVILADEPTGNLDSKTTIELMNILKSISQDKLVIMVTHEQALADYYADRIIEIENGKIVKDYPNEKNGNLSIIQEQIIYLKDYNKHMIEDKDTDVSRYIDTSIKKPEKLKVDLIERKDTLYVKVDSKKARRIAYIDNDSEIELLNESSEENIKKTKEKFVLEPIKRDPNIKNKSTITIKDSLIYALRKIDVLSYGGKMLYIVLGLVGVITSLSVGLLGETFRMEESYADMHRNYIVVDTDNFQYNEMMAYEDIEGVEQIMYITEEARFYLESNKYYEVSNSVYVESIPVDIKFFDEDLLIYGSMPDGYGIIIDQSIADEIIKENVIRGIESYEDIINCSFKLQTSGTDFDYEYDAKLNFPITGIAQDNSRTVWMDEYLLYTLVTPVLVNYELLGDNFSIIQGQLPTTYREVMINSNSIFYDNGTTPYSIGIATGEYHISGVYDYTVDGETYDFGNTVVTTQEYIKREYYVSRYTYGTDFEVFLYSNDVENTLRRLNELGYDASNIYLELDDTNMEIKLSENTNIYLLSITGFIVSAISIYFIMRSSLISRVYEVSVYRSLGASKHELRKMFFVEILLITSLSTILGYIIMTLLLIQAEANSGDTINLFHFTVGPFFLGILGLYIINIIFGLLPINVLLRKTPSDIIKKYDL